MQTKNLIFVGHVCAAQTIFATSRTHLVQMFFVLFERFWKNGAFDLPKQMRPHRIVSDKTLIASPTAAFPVKTKSGSFGSRVGEECIVMGFSSTANRWEFFERGAQKKRIY